MMKLKQILNLTLGGAIVMGGVVLFTSGCATANRIDKYTFDASMPFSKKYTRSISMHDDKEKIMVLTDLHFHGAPDEEMEALNKKTITDEFNDYDPDLIFVLGDSIDDHQNEHGFSPERWYQNQRDFIAFIDTFKTPWAPIFGNHETAKGHRDDDTYTQHSKPKLAELFALSKYCLFQWGPEGFYDGQTGGAGNYCINLTKDSKIIHSFIFMDTCEGNSWTEVYSSPQQIAWYQWMQAGLMNMSNKSPYWKTTLITHCPFDSYKDFSENHSDTDKCHYLYGDKGGQVWSQTNSDDFYPKIIATGYVDQIICGHDHTSDFSFYHKEDKIQLTYALKSTRNWNNDDTGDRDFDPWMLGYLALTVDKNNKVDQHNVLTSFT